MGRHGDDGHGCYCVYWAGHGSRGIAEDAGSTLQGKPPQNCMATGRYTDTLQIQTNAFHRYDADLGQVGIFLEPKLAMANHSCIPNAMVQFVGRKAILRAEKPIKVDEEIEISYTGMSHILKMPCPLTCCEITRSLGPRGNTHSHRIFSIVNALDARKTSTSTKSAPALQSSI